jgi:hypothetical protein
MPRSSSISPELHEEMSAKLEQLLDEYDDVKETKGRVSRALGGELKIIGNNIARVRRILKGIESPQTTIPGTDLGERRRDEGVLAILQAAKGVAARAEEEAPREGITAITLTTADGKAISATPERMRAALDELGRRKNGKKKPEVPPIEWRISGAGRVGEVADGQYLLDPAGDGLWAARWSPDSGRGKSLASGVVETEAADACLVHHVERQADRLLSNAGDGELTKADTKGDAVARKRR